MIDLTSYVKQLLNVYNRDFIPLAFHANYFLHHALGNSTYNVVYIFSILTFKSGKCLTDFCFFSCLQLKSKGGLHVKAND